MKRKLISIAVIFALCLTLLPVMSFADTPQSGYCGGEGDGTNLSWEL